jgi:hypothetical protein
MRTNQFQFIDAVIDPIPVFGPVLADMFHIWAGVADAMNLRRLAEPVPDLPPGDNVVELANAQIAEQVRKAA